MALKPKVLYNNVLRGVTPTWSGTTVSGKPPASATDWRDFSFFEADAGDLDFTMGSDTDIDSFSIYTASHSTSNTIALKYESGVSSFTTLQTYTATSGKLTFDEFSSVTVSSGRRIRISFTGGTVNVRQLVVGEALEMQRGQWDSAVPPTFTQGVKFTNTISENGSVLGRSIKRLERTGKIMLDHLTASWVRSDWEPFSEHCARYPFIYKWDPVTYSSEIGFAFATKINAPKHAGNSFLSVDMPLRVLVADEEAI